MFNPFEKPLPKTLQRLQERDDRIEIIERTDSSYDDDLNYYIGLAVGYRWSGYMTTGKTFGTVKQVHDHLFLIEKGPTS